MRKKRKMLYLAALGLLAAFVLTLEVWVMYRAITAPDVLEPSTSQADPETIADQSGEIE